MPTTRTSGPRLSGQRILVMEDEYLLADDIAKMLRSHGAEVVGPCGDVQDGVETVRDEPFIDAVILDINLGGEPAYAVANALKSREIPFMFATGYDGRSIPDEYAQVPRLEKPLEGHTLARTLASLLEGSAKV